MHVLDVVFSGAEHDGLLAGLHPLTKDVHEDGFFLDGAAHEEVDF